MARTLVGALALTALPSALAFRNTSPFFLFSTADVLLPDADASVADSATITNHVLEALKDCPTRSYIVATQQGVSSADYADAYDTPHLSQYMRGKHDHVRSTFSMTDVVGHVDSAAIVAYLQSKCRPKDEGQHVAEFLQQVPSTMSSGSNRNRKHKLQSHDAALEKAIEQATMNANSADYTVVFITTPPGESAQEVQSQGEQAASYEYSSSEPVQMELKRDLSSSAKRGNSTQGGLFERYQYFTPGLFMGFAAIIPLFLILLVGIRALTSLEVSYFAFSKEMGPNAQKKQ